MSAGSPGERVDVESEFTQSYDAAVTEPVQVWVFCRSCRCRIQVRTVPRPALPFTCSCGYAATLAEFDVFALEDDARRFAQTFEDLYQTTKRLLREAELPAPPKTRMYAANEVARILREPEVGDASETLETFSKKLAEQGQRVARARDRLAWHEAVIDLADLTFEQRARFPEARAHCAQACKADVDGAPETAREAARRLKRGEPVKLRFPTFRQLADLYEDEGAIDRAIDVARRAHSIGLPGYEERIARLSKRLAARGEPKRR